MEENIFNCEIITPMFLYGADGRTPDLRAPSLKGAMRFWWRAVQAENDIKQMKKKEDRIFGSSGEEGRSKFSIVLTGIGETQKYKMLPHHTGDRNCPYLPRCGDERNKCKKGFKPLALKPQNFKVKLRFYNSPEVFLSEKLKALFKLTSCLGGLGRRSRRGFGSFSIALERGCDSLEYLLGLLDIVASGNFTIKEESIILNKRCTAGYPFIRKIDVGRYYSSADELLKTIGQASHEAKVKYPCDKSLGSVANGRLASPIYVSVLKSDSGYRPIITTLNNNVSGIDTQKLNLFKEAIL